jgi:hypothetical protein
MTETKNRIIRLQYDPDNRDQWLEMRRRGIGGSDAATVVNKQLGFAYIIPYRDGKTGLQAPQFQIG